MLLGQFYSNFVSSNTSETVSNLATLFGDETIFFIYLFISYRSALHAAAVRDGLEVAALLLVNPGLSGLEVDDLCDPDE